MKGFYSTYNPLPYSNWKVLAARNFFHELALTITNWLQCEASQGCMVIKSTTVILNIPRLFLVYSTVLSVTQAIQCQMVRWFMNMSWRGYGRSDHGLIDLSICLEGLKKTMKSLSQDGQYPGWDSNWAHPEFKSRVLPLYKPAQNHSKL
jgi:hypothetical protein